MASAAPRPEPWKSSGVVRGPGIPVPSGQYAVGCVDLMHQFEGENDGLLVRLFYPTAAVREGRRPRYEYANWITNKRYVKGYLEYSKTSAVGLKAALVGAFLNPKIPALYGAPPIGIQLPLDAQGDQQPSDQPPPASEEGVKDQPPPASEEGVKDQPPPASEEGVKDQPPPDGEEGVKDQPPPASEEGVKDPTSEEGVKDQPPPASEEGTKDQPPTTEDQPAASEEGVTSQPANQEATMPLTTPPGVPFPVAIYSHGLGSMRGTYCAICCDLASNGYVVASVEHRDQSACVSLRRVPCPNPNPDKPGPQFQDEWLEFYHRPETEKEFPLRHHQVCQRAEDVRRSLDLLHLLNEGEDIHNMMEGDFDFKQFQGSMDVSKATVFGHSFGGATTIQTLSVDQRFKCGIALDCWMVPIHRDLYEVGIQQPLLFINSYDFQWVENVQQMMRLAKPPNDAGISTCRVVTLRGTNHFSQTDLVFILPKFTLKMMKYVPTLDFGVAHALNSEICVTFLKRFLHEDPEYQNPIPNLDGGEGHSEHILFGTNLDLSEKPAEGENEGEENQAEGENEGEESQAKGENKGEEQGEKGEESQAKGENEGEEQGEKGEENQAKGENEGAESQAKGENEGAESQAKGEKGEESEAKGENEGEESQAKGENEGAQEETEQDTKDQATAEEDSASDPQAKL